MYRPLVCLALGWIVGEWVANYFGQAPYWLGAIFAWFIGVFYYCRYFKGILAILFFIGITTSATYFSYIDQNNISFFSKPMVGYGGGIITSEPIVDGDRLRFDLRLDRLSTGEHTISVPHESIRIGVRLVSLSEKQTAKQLNSNCLIRLPLTLAKPASAGNPGAFDYASYLHHYQIHWQAEVLSFSQIQVLSCKSTLTTTIGQLRHTLSKQLTFLFPQKQAGLLQEMILGEQHTLDPETQEIFSTLGLVHVLSISGLHVAVLIGCLYFLLILCGLTREKAAIFLLIILPFYVLLTGSSAPVIRSAIMAGMMLFAIVLRKNSDAISFLSMALLIQLIWNPYQLWEPGFQLTFLITAGLLLLVEPLTHVIPLPWHRLRQAFAVMIVSQVLSYPIIIHYFYQYAWLSGLINLLLVPIYSVVVFPLASLTLLISFLWFDLGKLIASLITWVMTTLDQMLAWFSVLPYAVTSISPPSVWWVVCYALVLWLIYISVINQRHIFQRVKYVTLPIFVFLLIFSVWGDNWFRHSTTITMIDVGQGDSMLVETADGYVMLIDGGGTLPRTKQSWQKRVKEFEVGRDVLVPFLRYRGINHIDAIMMTHGDGDHIRGLEAVIKRFKVDRVIHSAAPPADNFERHLFSLLQQRNIPLQVAKRGDAWQVGSDIKASFLHPAKIVDASNANNGSLVMLLSVYRTNLLLTGDMEEPSEEEVLSHYQLQPVDILKVAHHGSNTSTHEAWISAVHPRYALISVGAHNRYGHPKPAVMARLHKVGAKVLRTDQQGAIVIQISPTGYKIKSMKGG